MIGEARESELLALAEGHFVDPAHDEHVRAVVAGHRAVAQQRAGHVGQRQRLPAVVVGHADGLGKGVGALQEQAVRQVLVDGDLEGVVVRARPNRPT